MKRFAFNILCAALLCVALPVRGEKQEKASRSPFIPDMVTVQYAGNIGMFAAGAGWEYAKERWMTELLLGYVPHYHNMQSLNMLTLRQTYTPWSWSLPLPEGQWGKLKFRPLSVGVYANAVLFDGDFWTQEPKARYDGDYYRFSTRVRFAFTIGERLIYEFPESWKGMGNSIEMYYELSTNELSIISAIPNKCIHLSDILALGIGARWRF
jgi:hypothetical protein